MPTEDLILDEQRKSQLDANLRQMSESGVDNEAILSYANDFKTKYGTSPKQTTSPQGVERGVSTSYTAPPNISPAIAETTPYTSPSGTIVSDFGKATTSSLGTNKAVMPSGSLVDGKGKTIQNKQQSNIEPSKDLTEVKSPYSVTIKNVEDKNKLNEDYSKQPEHYAKVVTSFNGLIADADKKVNDAKSKVSAIDTEINKLNNDVKIPSLHPELAAQKNKLYNDKLNATADYYKLAASKQAIETNKAKIQGIITDKERKLVQDRIDLPFLGNFIQGLHTGIGGAKEAMQAIGLENIVPAWMNSDVINPKNITEQYDKLASDKKALIQSLKENAVINDSKAIAEEERAKELGENPIRSYVGGVFGTLTPALLLAAGSAVTGTEAALPAMNSAFFGTLGYGASMAQGFNEAQKLGYNDEESYELAKNAARIGGTVQGVLGAVMGKTGEALGGLNPFNKAVTGSITKNAIKQGFTDLALKTAGTSSEFAGARLAENIGQKYLNPELSANKDISEGVGESAKEGALFHLTTSAMHAPKQILGKASLINSVSEAKTPEDVLELTNTIQQAKANNSITEGMATQLTQKVGRVKDAIDIVPDAFTDADVREKATELILRHQDVEEKLKKTPEALKPMVADELKAINVQFEELRNEQLEKDKVAEKNYGNRVVEQQVEVASTEDGGGVNEITEEKVQGGEEGVQEVKSKNNGINIIGADFALDKPNRKDFKEGVEGDNEYANANMLHNQKVDDTIAGLTKEGILTDSQGNQYQVTITSQGVKVVEMFDGVPNDNNMIYRKGKRTSSHSPFTNGFKFKEITTETPKATEVVENKLNTKENAIQEQSAGEILQREQGKAREAGSERQGVESSQQGQETTEQGKEEVGSGVGGDVGRKPIGDGKFVRYNPNDVLPLLPDYKPTNTVAVEDYVIQVVPNDASVEAYKTVPINAIQPSEKIESKDRKVIDKIKEGIKNGDDIPPLVLDFSPVIKNGETYKFGLMDGHHRYIAYKELGIKEVPAAIVTSREHYTFETNDTNIKTLFELPLPTQEVKTKPLSEQIADLRAAEQAEYDAMPNPNDKVKRQEIYDRYDEQITPLIREQKALEVSKQEPKKSKPEQIGEGLLEHLGIENIEEIKSAAQRVQKALEATGISVEVVESDKEFQDKLDAEGVNRASSVGASGVFVSKSGKIFINGSKVDAKWGNVDVWHEGTHPIINIIRNTNPALYKSIIDGLNRLVASNPEIASVVEWAKNNYEGENTLEDETIVETIARIANGNIDLSKLPTSLKDRIVDFINKIAKSLGIDPILKNSSIAEFKKVAEQVSNALKEGKDISSIVGKENVKNFESKITIKDSESYIKKANDSKTSEGINNENISISDISGNSEKGIQFSKGKERTEEKTKETVEDKIKEETIKAVKKSILNYKNLKGKISRTLFYDNTRVGSLEIKNRITGYTPPVMGKGGFFYSYMPSSLKNKAVLAFTSINQAIQTLKRQMLYPDGLQAIAAQNFQTAHLGNKSTLEALFGKSGSENLGIFQDSVKDNPMGEAELLETLKKATIDIANQKVQSGVNEGKPTASAEEIKKIVERNGGNLDGIKSLDDYRDKVLTFTGGDSFGARNILFTELLQEKPTKITKSTRESHQIIHYKYGIPTLSEIAEGNNQSELNNAETGDVVKFVKPYTDPIVYTTDKKIYKQYSENPTPEMVENGIKIKLLPEDAAHESYAFVLKGENVGLLDNYISATQLYEKNEKIANTPKKQSFYKVGRMPANAEAGVYPENPIAQGKAQYSQGNRDAVANKNTEKNNIVIKDNNIEGKLLNNKESQKLQKEIESKYNTGVQKFGQENEDIRQNLYNYDNPLTEKNVNGVNLRIASGLVEGKAYLGNRKNTYLLYADGKIAGKFYSVADAKKVVSFIEQNLIKPKSLTPSIPQFSKGKEQNSQIQDYIEIQRKAGESDADIRAGIESVADKLGLTPETIDGLMSGKKVEQELLTPNTNNNGNKNEVRADFIKGLDNGLNIRIFDKNIQNEINSDSRDAKVVLDMGFNEATLSKSEQQSLQALWRERHNSKQGMDDLLKFLFRHGAKANTETLVGQSEQQRRVLQGELSLGNEKGASQQQKETEASNFAKNNKKDNNSNGNGKNANAKTMGDGVGDSILNISEKDSKGVQRYRNISEKEDASTTNEVNNNNDVGQQGNVSNGSVENNGNKIQHPNEKNLPNGQEANVQKEVTPDITTPVSKESVSSIEKIKADSEKIYELKKAIKDKPMTEAEVKKVKAEADKLIAENKTIEKTNNLMDELKKKGLLRTINCL